MEYLYNSANLTATFCGSDCLITNQTLLTIYKEQLRKEGGKELTISSYILELDNDYRRLETKNDSYKFGIWINLNLNHFLLVSEKETALLEFDDKLELLEYLGSRWLVNSYLFIDCKTHVIDKHELRQQIKILDLKLQDKISYGVQEALEKEQICEDDHNDYYAGIMEACRV